MNRSASLSRFQYRCVLICETARNVVERSRLRGDMQAGQIPAAPFASRDVRAAQIDAQSCASHPVIKLMASSLVAEVVR